MPSVLARASVLLSVSSILLSLARAFTVSTSAPISINVRSRKAGFLEAQIAEEQARIDRSMSGENEYWGRESKGIEKSQAKIEQLKRDLDLVKKRAEAEGVPVDESNNSIKDAEGTGSTTSSPTHIHLPPHTSTCPSLFAYSKDIPLQ